MAEKKTNSFFKRLVGFLHFLFACAVDMCFAVVFSIFVFLPTSIISAAGS